VTFYPPYQHPRIPRKKEYKTHLETMNPLFPLTPLPTDIEQLVRQLSDLERRLRNTRRLDTTPQDILIRRQIPRRTQPIQTIEIIHRRIVQLELPAASDSSLNGGVAPEVADGVGNVAGEMVCFDLGGHGEDGGAAGVVGGGEGEVEGGEGVEDGAHGLDGVGEDDFFVGILLLVAVPAVVDEFHLFQDRGLSLRVRGEQGGKRGEE
jgi:hypothetical protein